MSTPSWAPFPIPTVSAVGVARPSAQGQATQMTAMAGMSACTRRPSEPAGTRKNHAQNTTSAISRMAGTNTAAMRSAMRWMGLSCPGRPPRRTMRASVESAPTRRRARSPRR